MEDTSSETLYFIDRTSTSDGGIPFIPDLEVGLPPQPQSQDLSAQNLIPNPLLLQINNTNTNANTNTNTNTSKPPQKDFSNIIKMIKRKIKNNCKEYNFRPYCIDGVFCYIVLYLKQKMLTVESINIKCNFNENRNYTPYVLYHKKYKSIEKVLQLIHKIVTSYKILNGDLVSATDYDDIKTEEEIIPYNENEICSVCLEHTTDTTSCVHFICLSCRDKCIIQKKRDCPICRCSNVLPTYMNVMQLINNVDYSELYELFYDKFNRIDDDDHDADNNSIISSSSSSSAEEEDDEEEDDEEENDEEEGQLVVEETITLENNLSGEIVITQEEEEEEGEEVPIQVPIQEEEESQIQIVIIDSVEEDDDDDQAMNEILLQKEKIRNDLIEIGLYDSDDDK